MSKILFEDKVALRELNLPRLNTITADDINEIKASVNALYDLTAESVWILDFRNALSISFVAPFDFIITADEYINGSPAVTYEVDGNPYSFDEVILKGSVVSISVDVNSVVVIAVSAEKIDNLYFQGGATGVNIYNSNGTLESNREIDLDGYSIKFLNGQAVFGAGFGSGFKVEIDGASDGVSGLAVGSDGAIALAAFETSGEAIRAGAASGVAVNATVTNGGTAIFATATNGIAGIFRGDSYIETYGVGGSLSSSAAFEVNSTTKGALIPRLTTTQRNSIPSPSTSLLIFNTTTSRFEYYNGTYWRGVVMRYLPIQFASWSPTDSQTVAFGSHPFIPVQASVSPNPFEIVMRGNGVIRGCDLNTYASGAVGTNEAWSLYVRHNGTDYLVQTLSLATANRVFTNQSLNIPFVDGDIVRMILVNPNWPTNPSNVAAAGSLVLQ